MLTRRAFLQSSPLLALAPAVPVFVARTAQAAPTGPDHRVLVVVQLDGGNDALNTVVPYADPTYARLRPRLKIPRQELLRLSDTLGLHPALRPLEGLLQGGQLAVVPGVGYPNPNRSHFESMAIWHTARLDPEERRGYGWLGRALDPRAATSYALGDSVPGALRGRRSVAVSLGRVEDLLLAELPALKQPGRADSADELLTFVCRQTVDAHAAAAQLSKIARGKDESPYPATGLGERLKLAARLLKSNLGARVFYTIQAGYDTHAAQASTHATLLAELAGAVAAFFQDLEAAKLSERVALLAFSEFGRTIQENGSAGTDHGTAGVVLLAGPGVRGGIAGSMPSLTELVDGEPRMTTDFRRIYASLLESWLGLSSRAVLDGSFAPAPLFPSMPRS
jgi:uncharacterized protein (DUF1501 family)